MRGSNDGEWIRTRRQEEGWRAGDEGDDRRVDLLEKTRWNGAKLGSVRCKGNGGGRKARRNISGKNK